MEAIDFDELTIYPRVDGRYEVEGRLNGEYGPKLACAIEAICAGFEQERGPIPPGPDAEREAERRRADAFVDLFERGLISVRGKLLRADDLKRQRTREL